MTDHSALAVGDQAPDLTLPSVYGISVDAAPTLAAFRTGTVCWAFAEADIGDRRGNDELVARLAEVI